MMDRRSFLGSTAAALAAGVPLYAFGSALAGRSLTQAELFAALPAPRRGVWLRAIMGSGVRYQKQIGLGSERASEGSSLFVETQIGMPGGSCNPNTLQKTYVGEAHFGALVHEYDVVAIVAHSGNTITRYADIGGGQPRDPGDAHLRLLDAAYLYDRRPMTVRSVARTSLHVAGAERETTHVVADYAPGARLRRVELWHAASLPFGVARYRVELADLEPFSLETYTFGVGFKTELDRSLAELRAQSPSGMTVDQ